MIRSARVLELFWNQIFSGEKGEGKIMQIKMINMQN